MSDLMDFGKVRNWKGALLFYFLYLVLVVLVAVIAGGLAGLWFDAGYVLGLRIGNGMAVLLSLGTGLLILSQKNHLKHLGYWLLVLLAGALSLIFGGVIGFIPLSFLTTRYKKK